MTATALLQAIVSDQPALAKSLFEDLMQPKLVSIVDLYRDQIASQMFNPELHEDDEEEDEDGEGEDDEGEEENDDDEGDDADEDGDEDEDGEGEDDEGEEENDDENQTAFEKDNP